MYRPLSFLLIIVVFVLFSPRIRAQTDFRVMWYNVENLFDCLHDAGKDDAEYLSQGLRRWTRGRYYHKLQQLAKVINAAGEWSTPALIGLCEVENDSVLIHLLTRTPLYQQNYHYLITDSPDRRGIDVALLYQRDKFRYLGHTCYRLHFRYHPNKRSRDLLHVWGQVLTGDTLDVFVCHFPSRSGGEKSSEPDRIEAASLLKAQTDSLFRVRHTANILLMGDFNDTPTDKSLCQTLCALSPTYPFDPTCLYNLFAPPIQLAYPGSHKYQGNWSLLDQFIASGTLLNTESQLHIQPASARLFAPPFLFTKDKTHRGIRPKRTYYGYKYEGGYSDHIPILIDFSLSLSPQK